MQHVPSPLDETKNFCAVELFKSQVHSDAPDCLEAFATSTARRGAKHRGNRIQTVSYHLTALKNK